MWSNAFARGAGWKGVGPNKETLRAKEGRLTHIQKINEAGYSTLLYGFYVGP